MTKIYDARDVARWFVAWAAGFDEGVITNLKLQKLLYYAQGTALVQRNQPLFRQDIQAWMHGPVVPEVYQEYKGFGPGPITLDDEIDWSVTDDETDELLASVWRTYGGLSAWRLREMTHAEDPWRLTFREDERHTVIPQDLIDKYFRGLYGSAAASV